MAEEKQLFTAADADADQRLDKFLAVQLPQLSRMQVKALIQEGRVRLNGKAASRPAVKLEAGDRVEALIAPAAEEPALQPAEVPLDVVYEDLDVAVVNKPAGMVVHPGAGREEGTLAQAALARWPQVAGVGEAGRPGIVHRLDKETSGLVVIAKTHDAYLWLVKQFKSRNTKKFYLALVDGQPPTPTGRIEAAIGRHASLRQKMAVAYGGRRKAVSEYRTMQSFNEHTLLEVRPVTGRTHQIRVHLAFIGCPVAGDKIYGRKRSSLSLGRFFLHASRLEIILPGQKEYSVFEAGLPADLLETLKELGA